MTAVLDLRSDLQPASTAWPTVSVIVSSTAKFSGDGIGSQRDQCRKVAMAAVTTTLLPSCCGELHWSLPPLLDLGAITWFEPRRRHYLKP